MQGKEIVRNVYRIPPIKAESENVVWRLNTCIYGLVDASRNWYLSAKENLTKIGINREDMILQYFTTMLKKNYKVWLLPMLMTFAGEKTKHLLKTLLVQKRKYLNLIQNLLKHLLVWDLT